MTLSPELESAILSRLQGLAIFDTLKFQVSDMSRGGIIATVPRQSQYDGIYESFHGGLLMTVADTIACFAVMTMIGTDEVLTTTDMNIRFLAPCLTDVTATARVIKAGRTLCPVQVDLHDANGRLVALAQVTYMRLPAMPSRQGE